MNTGDVPPPRARALLVCLALVLLVRPARAASFPPELHFRTLVEERVSVHFHDPHEATARQAASIASELLVAYELRYGQKVGRVQLVLADSEDEPNGFASPLPYPMVTVRLAAPNGSDSFGNHEGWLRLVLSHELAHVVHLEQARGLWRVGRALFGRAPYLFPNALSMPWMIEGLATRAETEHTAFGRGRNPDSGMVLRMAALEGRFPPEDRAIYALDAWPGGQTPYLFGEAFLRHLEEQKGRDAVPAIARQHAAQIVPFLDGRSVNKVTGRGLHDQWGDWAEATRRSAETFAAGRAAAGLTELRLLTRRGIQQGSPRFSPDGAWIAYTSWSLTRFPELRLMRSDGTEDRPLSLRNAGTGLAWTPDGASLVFAERQVHRTFSLFSDLSVLDVAGRRLRRLTRGARASDPDVSPEGSTVVFVGREANRSELFTVPFEGGDPVRITRSAAGVEWGGPRFSPDGGALVASRLLPGGWHDLVRVDLASGQVTQLTHDRAVDAEPTWTADGRRIVFRSNRDGASNLYALDLEEGSLWRLTNVLGGAFQPTVSPEGTAIAFSSYSARGYDLALAPFAPRPAEVAFLDPYPAPRPDPPPSTAPVRSYRPGSTLLPRFWTPWIEAGGGETRLGALTGGSDPLLRHLWVARAVWGLETDRASVNGYYLYDRFRPSLMLSADDTSDRVQESTEGGSVSLTRRTRRFSLTASLPLRRTLRSIQAVSLSYRVEDEETPASRRSNATYRTGGIEVAWTLSSARSYPYSISPADGGRLSLAWLHAAPALGSEDSFDKLTLDGRYYRRVFGERDVLAAQVRLGDTRGEPTYQPFTAGGYPDSSLFDAGANLALLRGYPENAFYGSRFASFNLEYRFPLVSPQRGWRSAPVFLRHLRGTVFADVAGAWTGSLESGDLKRSVGASLGLDSAVGFSLPATAELAVAHGFDEQGDTTVYLRFGLAF